MKKVTAVCVGVAALLVCAWAAGAWYTGQRLESRASDYLARLNDTLAEQKNLKITVSQLAYERGWFSTEARYEIKVSKKSAPDAPVSGLQLSSRFEHGPFPISALARGQFQPLRAYARAQTLETDDLKQWLKASQGQTPLTADVALGYDGQAKFDAHLAPLRVTEDGGVVEFGGADLTGSLHVKARVLEAVLTVPKFSLDVPGVRSGGRVQVDLTDSRLDFHTRPNAFDIQSGGVALQIERLVMHSGETGKLDMTASKLAAGVRSGEDEKFMRGELYLNTQNLLLSGLDFGSQSVAFKLGRVDGSALKSAMDAYARDQQLARNAEPATPEQKKEGSDAIKALILAKPTLDLDDLHWTTGKGSSALSIHTEWGMPAASPLMLGIGAAPALQMLKLLRADLRVNKAMAVELGALTLQAAGKSAQAAQEQAEREVNEGAAELLKLGLLEEEAGVLKSRVEFGREEITINGKPIPPELHAALAMILLLSTSKSSLWPRL
jgi:uncharacterized protein YdgA (DUF945 family)